ncbi:MAG: serine/threonine protein kinase [Proteobacteria bacterium]|jgi:serine/threonine protein kinase|nr:serine/threonine protein kinase [Pseudomonadota bacterium]
MTHSGVDVPPVPKSFEIKEILASGNYGTVCVAIPAGEDRLVAIKVLNADQAANTKVLRRTRDEARILNRLNHPNIVHVDHLLELQGKPLVVMEYVAGAPVDALIRHLRSGLPPAIALDIVRQVALALHAAYTALTGDDGLPMRIIHRDIKPGNILISTAGEVKVVDFGIAKAEFEDREAYTASMVMGSQGFDAPERLDDVSDSPAVDVYSLGLTLALLLTGKMLVLPRLPVRHDEVLATQLNYLRPADLDEAQQSRLRELISHMCTCERQNRPRHRDVSTSIAAFMEEAQLKADMVGFAQQFVSPIYQNRPRSNPKRHPLYGTLEFLDIHDGESPLMATTMSPTEKPAIPTLEEFLSQPDWEKRRRELKELLDRLGSWDTAPFLAILQRATTSKWHFWVTKERPARVAAALLALRTRPSREAVVLAKKLKSHEDKEVREAAKNLLSNQG